MSTASWQSPPDAHQRGTPPPEGLQIWHEDDRGRRHGPAVRWYPGGTCRSQTEYRHGQRHGPHRAWHPDGTLALEGHFEQDLEQGLWRSYGTDGHVQMELPCQDGRSQGPCRSFYPGGALAREWTARDGKEDGLVTVFLQDGQRFSEETFVHGQRHGSRAIWLAGVRIIEEHWVHGVQDGPYRMWAMTGQLLQEGEFRDGRRHGHWRFWNYVGRVQSEGTYEEGVPMNGWQPPSSGMVPAPPTLPPASTTPPIGAPTATTVVTGFLGSGKTTVILDMLRQKPAGERWAIYVNEFGEVGVDAAALPEASEDGLVVHELPGGCACCSSNLPFVEGIGQVIDTLQPDHLIIEPTGIADTQALIASLKERLGERLELRGTLCVVDPRRLQDDRYVQNPAYMAQLNAADVVIANRCDLASTEDLVRFHAMTSQLPNLSGVLETEMGRVDIAWLTIAPRITPTPHRHHHAITVQGRSFVYPEGWFSRTTLDATLPSALPAGWMRFKGVITTDAGRWVLHADEHDQKIQLQWHTTTDSGPSRFECIADKSNDADWDTLRHALEQAHHTP